MEPFPRNQPPGGDGEEEMAGGTGVCLMCDDELIQNRCMCLGQGVDRRRHFPPARVAGAVFFRYVHS